MNWIMKGGSTTATLNDNGQVMRMTMLLLMMMMMMMMMTMTMTIPPTPVLRCPVVILRGKSNFPRRPPSHSRSPITPDYVVMIMMSIRTAPDNHNSKSPFLNNPVG